MITKEIDVKSWAIKKACSVALSIACGGVGKFVAEGAKAAVEAGRVVRGLRAGAKAIANSVKATAEEGMEMIGKDIN